MQRHKVSLPQRLASVTRTTPDVAPSQSVLADRARALQQAADAQAMTGLLQSLAAIVEGARKQKRQTIADLAQQSVELGVTVAERLLGAAVELDRQRLDQIVLASLERLATTGPVVLRAHPDDIALVHRQIETNPLFDAWRESLTFHPDPASSRGRLVLEADELFVEWDTQKSLAEMRTLLLDQIFTEA
jgi:flagellar biosynthesis/type III secretory pathway protein FliH